MPIPKITIRREELYEKSGLPQSTNSRRNSAYPTWGLGKFAVVTKFQSLDGVIGRDYNLDKASSALPCLLLQTQDSITSRFSQANRDHQTLTPNKWKCRSLGFSFPKTVPSLTLTPCGLRGSSCQQRGTKRVWLFREKGESCRSAFRLRHSREQCESSTLSSRPLMQPITH